MYNLDICIVNCKKIHSATQFDFTYEKVTGKTVENDPLIPMAGVSTSTDPDESKYSHQFYHLSQQCSVQMSRLSLLLQSQRTLQLLVMRCQ